MATITVAQVLKGYRCTVAEYFDAKKIGAARPYSSARNCARQRRIAFELTLPEWVSIWLESGHWTERGIAGYVMCRRGDAGPYAVGTVYIAPYHVNHAEMVAARRIKCAGIFRTKAGRFAARIKIKRRCVHLGVRSTKQEARSLYLEAVAAAASSPDGNLPVEFRLSIKTTTSRSRALSATSDSAIQFSVSSALEI